MLFLRKSGMIVLAGVTASMMLSACSSMPWDKKPTTKVEPVTITNKSVTVAPSPLGYGEANYNAMASAASGGSVEVYNLDSGKAYGGSGNTVYQDNWGAQGGIPLASDAGVTVYPLDDAYATYGQMPPHQNYASPISGQGSGGVMSSRTGPGVSSVYFPYGSSSVTGYDRNTLRSVAEAAKFAPVDRVLVEGHASPQTQTSDPVEARILNLRESLKRAGTVAETLIEEGVPAEKIKTVGWGDTKLAPGGEEQQRRVDIVTTPGAY